MFGELLGGTLGRLGLGHATRHAASELCHQWSDVRRGASGEGGGAVYTPGGFAGCQWTAIAAEQWMQRNIALQRTARPTTCEWGGCGRDAQPVLPPPPPSFYDAVMFTHAMPVALVDAGVRYTMLDVTLATMLAVVDTWAPAG